MNEKIHDCFDLEWVKVRQSKPCTDVPLEVLVYLVAVLIIAVADVENRLCVQ